MSEVRTVMARMFVQKSKPTMFLASRASVVKTKAVEVQIDVRRGKELIAVDIAPGAGSRSNKRGRFTTKKYAPPCYNESTTITAEMLQERTPGVTIYQEAAREYMETAMALVTDTQAEHQDKIIRAIEVQTRDAIFDGVITLHDGDTVDFKKKATHTITPTSKWSATTGTPVDDIAAGCALCRKDGLIGGNVYDLIVADDVLNALINNEQFQAKANLRHVQTVNMGMPANINIEGAVFHGQFSAGSYVVNLWTYPQFYEVPTVPAGLTNAGEVLPYIPEGKAALLPQGLDFRLVFAGVPVIVNQVDPAVQAMFGGQAISVVEADFVPFAHIDVRKKCIEAGVESRPLFIPVQIDGFCTFDTLV